jgi:hypothetical protein
LQQTSPCADTCGVRKTRQGAFRSTWTRAWASASAFLMYHRGVGETLNTDKHWSRMDIADLRWQAAFGDTVVQIARFLNRSEADVRDKAKQLGVIVKERRGR